MLFSFHLFSSFFILFQGVTRPRPDQKVVFDPCWIVAVRGVENLADLYGVGTGIFNRQVRRNIKRFPEDFMFQKKRKSAGQVAGQVGGEVRRLLEIMNGEMTRAQMQTALNLKRRDNFENLYLRPALRANLVEMTIPEKPKSRLQKYRLAEKGRRFKSKF